MSESETDDTDHCANCGDEVCTIIGMDNFVEVTHYDTTEFAEVYYCDEVCLEQDLAGETAAPSGTEMAQDGDSHE